MPCGISTGSDFLQLSVEQLFAGQPFEFLADDVLIWGRTSEEYDNRFRQVLSEKHVINMKLNPDKGRFRVNSVQYCGHLLTAGNVKPDLENTKAVCGKPTPQDKQTLQQFLGMTNYLSKFTP